MFNVTVQCCTARRDTFVACENIRGNKMSPSVCDTLKSKKNIQSNLCGLRVADTQLCTRKCQKCHKEVCMTCYGAYGSEQPTPSPPLDPDVVHSHRSNLIKASSSHSLQLFFSSTPQSLCFSSSFLNHVCLTGRVRLRYPSP